MCIRDRYEVEREANSGNDSNVMPELRQRYRRKYPRTAKGIESKVSQAASQSTFNSDDNQSSPQPPTVNDNSNENREEQEAQARRAE